jgi:YVTN family beta-propeller protein
MKAQVSSALCALVALTALLGARPPDASASSVVGTITGLPGARFVEVDRVHNRICVSNGSATFWTIDGATRSVIAHSAGGEAISDIALNGDGSRMYFSTLGDKQIYWFDPVTLGGNWFSSTEPNFMAGEVHHLAVDPDTGILYAAGPADAARFDPQTGFGESYNVPGLYSGVALNRVTRRLYLRTYQDTVRVLHLDTKELLAEVPVGPGTISEFANVAPRQLAVNENTNRVYVPSLLGAIDVIDGSTNTVVATINVGGVLRGVAASPNGRIYVTDEVGSQLVVIDGATHQVVETLPVGFGPSAVALANDAIYVASQGHESANFEDGSLTIIDPRGTPPGTDVQVAPSPTTLLTFSSVSDGGATTVAPVGGTPTLPSNFQVASTSGAFPTYFEITSTVPAADISKGVTVSVAYDPVQFPWHPVTNPGGGKPTLLHFVSGAWRDITTSVDVTTHTVSGFTTSFSPFAVVKRTSYSWSGVLQPVNASGTSVFKLGRAVPVKFSLTGLDSGITNLQALLYVAKVSSDVVGTEEEAVSTAAATTGNLFRYDAASGQYVFNLSTQGGTVGTYRLRIDLGDGQVHTVDIGLR